MKIISHYINRFSILSICIIIYLCYKPVPVRSQSIIPLPQSMKMKEGHFTINESTKLYMNLKGKDKRMMRKYLQTLPYEFLIGGSKDNKNIIKLNIITEKKNEKGKSCSETDKQKYTLNISSQQIEITASDAIGIFYGIQSLLQLTRHTSATTYNVACAEITDYPRFKYRGLMLDVSRHFFPKEFIFRQIDALAYFKINYFHLHLTDAAGWRIQIKKYPKLTEETAYRTESDWNKWWVNGNRLYCKKDNKEGYGGYYTQHDIKEIVKYAALRHITIIPEIEMPGHSEEVLYAYPELSCSGKPYQNGELCIGKEITFRFLENVLKEVIKLFPSEYIHIGGDEANKNTWKTCPLCQKRMKDEHLKNEEELQSYLICRIERFLNSRGRKLLGWDEIIEGKLASKATVMSWRGEQGGIEAAKSGHHAIMTPEAYCYINNVQDAPDKQPTSNGGYLPLDKVYSYEPIPDSLKNTPASLYIDGLQANLWTEHITSSRYAEYMTFPRILAISEVGWTKPDIAGRTYENFRNRVLEANKYLALKGYNVFDLEQEEGHRKESMNLIMHDAIGKKVQYNSPYSQRYKANGDSTLTDGKRGDWSYGDGAWQGFITHNKVDVTIDMEKTIDIHDISADFMQSSGPYVFAPAEIIISTSDDGINFKQIDKQEFKVDKEPNFFIKTYNWKGNASGRYIRYQAHSSNTYGGWIFTDEIIVNRH